MADEKIFIISLRKEVLKTPIYKRAKKAISTVKNYIKKHLKVEEVKLGENLNKKIWEKGSKKPPGKIKVKAIKEENLAKVELPEFPFPERKKKEEKTKEKILPQTEKQKEEQEEQKLLEEGKAKKRIKKQKEIKPEIHEDKTKEERIVSDDKKSKTPLWK